MATLKSLCLLLFMTVFSVVTSAVFDVPHPEDIPRFALGGCVFYLLIDHFSRRERGGR